MGGRQDKAEEVRFFGEYAKDGEYDVFTPDTNEKIVARCVALSGLRPGARVADLGCGTGVFTRLLEQRGLLVWGLDISHALTVVGRRKRPELRLVVGDIERLPFPTDSFEGVMLSGVVHHLPDPAQCAREVYRVLMPGGVFTAFDPNRMNPFMWLYRDLRSPFYSRVGVTENERPVLAGRLSDVFSDAGFSVKTDYLSGLRYRHIASTRLRWALPIYNSIDSILFTVPFLRRFSAFVLTVGVKP